MDAHVKKAREVVEQVNKIIIGKEEIVKEIMLAFLANGHILLEDIPGVGKTTLALAFSKTLGLDCRRVQFTPDVMPSDLTGFSVYRKDEEKFVYQPGSVFCNLLLADEINRTSPKTQSALLEVMEERKVSVEGTTRDVPKPFLVIATQNPYGAAGTQYLPEAQLDRFMASMSLGYPDYESELKMAMSIEERNRLDTIEPIVDKNALIEMQSEIHGVYIKESVYRYILDLISATREYRYFERGVSPRATIALVKLAKAAAWYEGREFATPNDVMERFPYVVSHRLSMNMTARMESVSKEQAIYDIIQSVEKPPMGDSGR